MLLLACAACGREGDLLEAADADALYYSGAAGAEFRPTSMDPSVRGTISGMVKYQGRPYRVRRLETSTDKFCLDQHPNGVMSEDFLWDPANGALEGVIVWVKKGLSTEKWEVPAEPVVLDQKGCQYVPHVAVVQTGQPLVVKSSDNTLHNVHGLAGPNPEFNHAMSTPGQLAPKVFTRPEMAKKIICDVHGWMSTYVGVVQHPYWAITAKDGKFTLADVPPGTYLLGAWHEKLGELESKIQLDNNGTATHEFMFERR